VVVIVSVSLKNVTRVISHRLYYGVTCAQNVGLQHERKRVDANTTRQQHI